jgi:hypothetical protein
MKIIKTAKRGKSNKKKYFLTKDIDFKNEENSWSVQDLILDDDDDLSCEHNIKLLPDSHSLVHW